MPYENKIVKRNKRKESRKKTEMREGIFFAPFFSSMWQYKSCSGPVSIICEETVKVD